MAEQWKHQRRGGGGNEGVKRREEEEYSKINKLSASNIIEWYLNYLWRKWRRNYD
jgi:hypothetical protein